AKLEAKADVQFIHLPCASLKVARQHIADGSASFEDRITLILYNCMLQQWDEVFKQLDAAEKLADGKPEGRWLRTELVNNMRKNDEARKRLLDEARKLVAAGDKTPPYDQLYLADTIQNYAQRVSSPQEQYEFVQLLKPVYERQPADLNAMFR